MKINKKSLNQSTPETTECATHDEAYTTALINRLTFVSIAGNVVLSIFKLIAGLFGHSSAMVSDAVHSLSDVITTVVAYIGVKISEQEADKEHPYGHERFECVAAMLLSLILAFTGLGIGYTGLEKIMAGDYQNIAIPTILPLIAAVLSIVVKEGMYRYTLHYANIMDSDAFRADAWHHRSDALSSIGAFVGILAARMGFPIMDPVSSLVICLFILKAAYDILTDALNKMLDTPAEKSLEKEMKDYIKSHPEVTHVDMMHTRRFGNKIYVDIEIAVPRDFSLVEAHDVAEQIHHGIEDNYSNVKHVMVHVNPSKTVLTAQTQA